MQVQTFAVGKFLANCYVVNCSETLEAIIIDPSFDEPQEAERTFGFINGNKLKPKYIVDTHGHPDHTCGNGIAKKRFGIPILIHKDDAHMIGEQGKWIGQTFGLKSSSPPPDILLNDGELLEFGKASLRVLHTPGHSRGGISLLGDNEIFTGDTLFAGSIGRTDFPDSSETEMRLSLEKLKTLPDHLLVYSGHGPETILGQEKRSNPFL